MWPLDCRTLEIECRTDQASAGKVKRASIKSCSGLSSKAIGEAPKERPVNSAEEPAAVTLGRLGGLKGGKARAAKLDPIKRKEIAQKAARKRSQNH
jgi:hypothetical protein